MADPVDQPPRRSRWRAEPWLFLELFALCGFVVVQPLLAAVGDAPDFFIFHGIGGGEVAALVAIVVLVPPVALWAVGALAGLAGPRVRRAVHLATVAGLAVLLMIELGKHVTPIRGVLLVALAVVVAAVIVAGYVRLDVTRQLLRFAAVGPLVFVLLFTFASPSSAVVLAGDRPSGDRPSGGGPAQVTGAHPPIVMILLDEFAMLSLMDERGRIDAGRFPNFARLAGDSTWYRNATASSGWTPYAVPSMLTGRWPAEHVAPHYAVYPDNLFTLLGDVYEISAWETITKLCPPRLCTARDESGGLPVALAESTSLLRELVSPTDAAREPYDDYAEPTLGQQDGITGEVRNDPRFRWDQLGRNQPLRFHEFISGLQADTGAPRLDFLHLLLPHTPWTYYPDGTRYKNLGGLPVDGEWWGRLAHQRYLRQLGYTDRLIGVTLDTLHATGRYEESLVVVTADHGVSLTPGKAGIRELVPSDPGIVELAWVPLFIKEPGQTESAVDDRNWQHVDLLPTIADYAGFEVPWEVDGISWRRTHRAEPEKTFYSELDKPGVLDGPAGLAEILADPTAYPLVPPAPLPELVGTAVSAHPVVAGEVRAEVANAAGFEDVNPAETVPALVHGTVPASVPLDTPLAIAVNGRISAVVPVVESDDGGRRYVGMVDDSSRFVPGANQLELFLVPDGTTLHQIWG